MNLFKNKIVLIIGGTGSFGTAFLNKIGDNPLKEITKYHFYPKPPKNSLRP